MNENEINVALRKIVADAIVRRYEAMYGSCEGDDTCDKHSKAHATSNRDDTSNIDEDADNTYGSKYCYIDANDYQRAVPNKGNDSEDLLEMIGNGLFMFGIKAPLYVLAFAVMGSVASYFATFMGLMTIEFIKMMF